MVYTQGFRTVCVAGDAVVRCPALGTLRLPGRVTAAPLNAPEWGCCGAASPPPPPPPLQVLVAGGAGVLARNARGKRPIDCAPARARATMAALRPADGEE